VSPPDPNAVLFPDASVSEETSEAQDADALVDAGNSTEAFWSTPAGFNLRIPSSFNRDSNDHWRHASPPETAKEAERRRLRGSPSDTHTPEGTKLGYAVYHYCPTHSGFDVVDVFGTGKKDFPQFGPASPSYGKRPSEEIEKEFWAFVSGVRRAAAVSSIHAAAASAPCFGIGYAVILNLHDWRQVDQAIRNVGSWLAVHNWRGEVILWPESIRGPGYSK
jgi:hypothetical protein